jgi:hypothetical protein
MENHNLDNAKRIKRYINPSETTNLLGITSDDIADISLSIVDEFVQEGLCPNCIDTDDDTEFQYQDIIREHLNELFNINSIKK